MLNDYKEVGLSEHVTVGTAQTIQSGQEIHLKAGGQIVIDGGLSLTLKAGGQHIVLNPAGIWMTMPVWTGGVPMVGTPAVPILPMATVGNVTPTVSPPVNLESIKQARQLNTARAPICPLLKNKENQINKLQSDTNQIDCFDEQFLLVTDEGDVLVNTPYTVRLADGSLVMGISDDSGHTKRIKTKQAEMLEIYIGHIG